MVATSVITARSNPGPICFCSPSIRSEYRHEPETARDIHLYSLLRMYKYLFACVCVHILCALPRVQDHLLVPRTVCTHIGMRKHEHLIVSSRECILTSMHKHLLVLSDMREHSRWYDLASARAFADDVLVCAKCSYCLFITFPRLYTKTCSNFASIHAHVLLVMLSRIHEPSCGRDLASSQTLAM